jgi:hypothetical protein
VPKKELTVKAKGTMKDDTVVAKVMVQAKKPLCTVNASSCAAG